MSNIEQMSSFLRGFKFIFNRALSDALKDPEEKTSLSEEAKKDLMVWANYLADGWHEIDMYHCYTPLRYIRFASDAAGCSEAWAKDDDLGCGVVGFDEDGRLFYCDRFVWEKDTIINCKDSEGKRLGCKTTTLEFMGILLPYFEDNRRAQRQIHCSQH